MTQKVAPIAASIAPLILTTAGALAGESEFRAPAIQRTEQTQTLLTRTAHAINAGITRTGAEQVSNSRLDWSASIGAGHAANGTEPSVASVGSPASPDWSASIGTGHVTSNTEAPAASVGSPSSPHWSASIATGHISTESTHPLLATTQIPAASLKR